MHESKTEILLSKYAKPNPKSVIKKLIFVESKRYLKSRRICMMINKQTKYFKTFIPDTSNIKKKATEKIPINIS